MKRIDYKIGDKINGIEYAGNESTVIISDKPYRKAYFICACGTLFNTFISFIRTGHTKSCGCGKIGNNYKHGQCVNEVSTPEYSAWQHMKDRCYNENDKAYKYYGAKGKKVCDRWLESFENFFYDMGNRPSSKHSLDRFPNNNGNYEPSNCRWATDAQQKRNRSDNIWIEYQGILLIAKDWANLLGTTQKNLTQMYRIKPFDEVFNHYNKKHHLCLEKI